MVVRRRPREPYGLRELVEGRVPFDQPPEDAHAPPVPERPADRDRALGEVRLRVGLLVG